MGSMRMFVFYWQLLARFSSFQYWVPCGDFGLWLQKLRKLQNAVKEAEGSAKRERILHAASSASSPPRATDAAEARKRGRGRQVFTLKLCWLSRLVIILSISRLFFPLAELVGLWKMTKDFPVFWCSLSGPLLCLVMKYRVWGFSTGV